MHMIKKSYEKCATKYQETMHRIAEENNNPTTTTTTTTTKSPWTSDLSNYVVLGRNTEVQQIRGENTNQTTLSPEQEYIKQICWQVIFFYCNFIFPVFIYSILAFPTLLICLTVFSLNKYLFL